MIFKKGRKRESESPLDDATDDDEEIAEASGDEADSSDDSQGADLAAVEDIDWRSSGPFDITEVESVESTAESPKIDLGSLILTAVPGAELRLQVAEETGEIVWAMLVIETVVEKGFAEPSPMEAQANASQKTQAYSSALELAAYAAPRSGGLWAELRDEISRNATEAGGTASLGDGPFGVELRRLIPVTTPEGEEGYQPSRMWVAEGPRWLLRGIVYGQAAIEEDTESPVVADVLSAFRQVIVRRGDEAMAPGDQLPLTMPSNLSQEPESDT